jgi:hypothetical protein
MSLKKVKYKKQEIKKEQRLFIHQKIIPLNQIMHQNLISEKAKNQKKFDNFKLG